MNNKVYILNREIPYEGNENVGVFYKYEDAQKSAERLAKSCTEDNDWIAEFDEDEQEWQTLTEDGEVLYYWTIQEMEVV